MPTAILITNHYLKSRRRAGFHWLADALHRRGWRVIMMTAPVSWVSVLRRDHRLKYGIRRQAKRLIWHEERLGSYVWWTPLHPIGFSRPLFNRLMGPLCRGFESSPLGPITDQIEQADCFIFESTAALVLAERFQSINPRARMVYRVSDDLRTLRVHPDLRERELDLAERFDRISSPTQAIHQKFAHLPAASLDPHGVPVHHYEQCVGNPYGQSERQHAVFIGVSRLDRWFIDTVSRDRPNVDLHIIGPFRRRPKRSNVHFTGELPFDETVPYVKFADVGLHTITGGVGAESFADSLKVLQYCWCRLPIVVPRFLAGRRENMLSYTPDDAVSALAAFVQALAMPREDRWRDSIYSWDVLAARLVGEHDADSPSTTGSAMSGHAPARRS